MECGIADPSLRSKEAALVAYVVLEATYSRLPTLVSQMFGSEIEPRSSTSIVIYVGLIRVASIDYHPTREPRQEMNASVIFVPK